MGFDDSLDKSLKKFGGSCINVYGCDLDKVIQTTKERREIKKKRYYKTQHLIWLIEQAEGVLLEDSYFNDKDGYWLDKEIEFYEYVLEK